MALPPPFPTAPQNDSLANSMMWLNKAMDSLAKKPLFHQAGFAVADLSGRASYYAGWNLHKPRFSGSVVKIAAMFAAYQLRERLKLAARGLKKDAIFKAVTAGWDRLVARSVAGPENFPQLDQIFTPSDGDVAFTKQFEDDLKLMISDSDTGASGRCIRKLGHQYINGALEKEGLYSAKRSGLWLGGDYNAIEYQKVAGADTHYAATPAALLRFLDLLNTGRLVSPAACGEMKALMNNFYSIRLLKIRGEGVDRSSSFGKLGWEEVGGVKTYFDAGVIHRWTDKGDFRYAIVVLGLPNVVFIQLADLLDAVIVNWRHELCRSC